MTIKDKFEEMKEHHEGRKEYRHELREERKLEHELKHDVKEGIKEVGKFDKEIDKQRVNDQFAVFFLAEIFVAHLRKQLVYVVVNFRISFGSDIKRLRQEGLNAGETFQFGN